MSSAASCIITTTLRTHIDNSTSEKIMLHGCRLQLINAIVVKRL